MAYNKEEIYKQVISVIRDNNIKFFDHIEPFIEPDVKTLDRWGWKNGECPECTTIKREISNNRTSKKMFLIDKWIDSDNATLQIAAYKLLGDDEDRKKLSSSYIDHTSNNNELKSLTGKPMTRQELEEYNQSSEDAN